MLALREEIANSQGLVTVPQATATAQAGLDATATAASWTPTPEPTVAVSAPVTSSGWGDHHHPGNHNHWRHHCGDSQRWRHCHGYHRTDAGAAANGRHPDRHPLQ